MPFKRLLYCTGIAMLACTVFISCEKDEPGNLVEKTFETVNGFIISQSGEKIIATDNGLFLLNENTGNFEYVKTDNDVKPINDLAFSKSSTENELWLATNEGILNFNNQKLITSSNSGLKNDMVNRLDFDYNSRGLFATPGGLSILNNNKWSVSTGLNDIYLNFEITDIAASVNGYFYVTTKGGGVERIEMDVDGISGATIFDSDWTLLETNNINTVYIDSITQVYGTDKGVAFHYSEFTKWDWEIFTSKNGLINDNVISIVNDKSGNWWFGTTLGLSRFNESGWTNYSVETHHLISNNIKFLAVGSDGSVCFASDEGLSVFAKNKWTNYSKKPQE